MAGIVDKRKVGPVTILELGPRLTGAEVPEFNETIKDLLEHGTHDVLLDCSSVTFMDSLGIGALVRSWASVEKKGKLRLLGLSPRLREVLQITGLLKVMGTFDDVGEALRSF
jgi:anti-sigma B factor antagonist